MTLAPARSGPRNLVLLAAGLVTLAAAVAIRVEVAGPARAQSGPAGLVFGVLLLVAASAYGSPRIVLDRRQIVWGLAAAGVLCVPSALTRFGHAGVALPLEAFPRWAAVVTVVAVAEEMLLRGALYELVLHWRGERAAIILTAIAFAALHVPVYGWHVLPIDLAAGFVLGLTRAGSGSVTAPAITHVVADLATWWLR